MFCVLFSQQQKQEEQKKTLMTTHDTDTHSYTYYIEEVNITTTKIIINKYYNKLFIFFNLNYFNYYNK